MRNSASVLRGLYTSSAALILASLAFVTAGVVRTKLAAVEFGPTGVAVFGQLSQAQTVVVTIGGAGIVTAARVVVARERDRADVDGTIAALLWTPFVGSLVLAAILASQAEFLAQFMLGNPEQDFLVLAGLAGAPFAILSQVAIACAQARGDRLRLLLSAVVSSTLSGGATAFLMSSGDYQLAATSLVVAPSLQAMCILAICRSVRSGLRCWPRIQRPLLLELGYLSWASAFLGITAAVSEAMIRANAVQAYGVDELAGYQPTALLVGQLATLALSAVATTMLVDLAQIEEAEELVGVLRRVLRRLVPLASIAAIVLVLAGPVLVALLFSKALVAVSMPVLVTAASGEPLRAYSWAVGSVLLPRGHRDVWLGVGLGTVAVQFGTAIVLLQSFGVIGLAAGSVTSNSFAAVLNTHMLRLRGIPVPWSNVLVAHVFSGAVAVVGTTGLHYL